MLRSRSLEAAVIGCLAALATFCALSARAADTYSVVAQSSRATAATGRRPLAERIAAANLPIVAQSGATATATAAVAVAAPPNTVEDGENRSIPPVAVASAEAAAARADAEPAAAAAEAAAKSAPATGPRLPWMSRQPARTAARPAPTRR